MELCDKQRTPTNYIKSEGTTKEDWDLDQIKQEHEYRHLRSKTNAKEIIIGATPQDNKKESSKFFEVEVNYLADINIVRLQHEDSNSQNGESKESENDDQQYKDKVVERMDYAYTKETMNNAIEDIASDDVLINMSVVNKMSKEVYEKYIKLCNSNQLTINVSEMNKDLNHTEQSGVKECTHNDFVCEICECSFSNNVMLAKHILRHEDGSVYDCDMCDKKFVKYGSLKVHKKRNHSSEKQHECDDCYKIFACVSDLNQHKVMHSSVKKYNCAVCSKRFARSAGLRRHKLVHTGIKPHECEICLKRFTQSGDLKKHLMYHRGEKPYQCDICFKYFSQASNLNQHRKTHSGIRSFFCDVCFKVFQSNSNLKHHQLIHAAVKCFQCDVCHKSFIRGGDLKKHKIIHGGERKFLCHLCQRPFLRNGDLKKHMAIHKGILPSQTVGVKKIKDEITDWNNLQDFDETDTHIFSSNFSNFQVETSHQSCISHFPNLQENKLNESLDVNMLKTETINEEDELIS